MRDRVRRRWLILPLTLLVVAVACEVPEATSDQQLGERSTTVKELVPVDVTCSYADEHGAVATTLQVFEPEGDHYVPPPGYAVEGRRPAIVWVTGGGWSADLRHSFDQGELRPGGSIKAMLDHGWVVVAAAHRLAPDHVFPAQVVDTKAAVNCTRDLTGAPGISSVIDQDRVVLAGSSSGGHLATLAALSPGTWEPRPPQSQAGSGGRPSWNPSERKGAPPEDVTTVQAVVNLDGPTDLRHLVGPDSNLTHFVEGLFCGEATESCEAVGQWIDHPQTPASPIDWVSAWPMSDPPPRLYLACGHTWDMSPGFEHCADNRAMYERMLDVHGNDPEDPTSAVNNVWLDQTPGNHFQIDVSLHHVALRLFLAGPFEGS